MKSIRTLFLLLACMAFDTLAAQVPADSTATLSENYLRLLSEADAAIEKADWAKAEDLYLEAVRSEPSCPTNLMLMSNIGMMRHYSGRDSLALEILDAAVRMAPKASVIRKNRSTVLLSLGRTQEAVNDQTIILSMDSANVDARYMRSLIALKRGEVDKAKTDIDFLLKQFPDSLPTHTAAAYLYIIEHRYAEALPHLNKVIEGGADATDYGERALCNLMTDNLNEASSDLADAMRLDPLNGDFYIYRALLNKRRYRPKEAEADIRRAAELGANPAKLQLFNF